MTGTGGHGGDGVSGAGAAAEGRLVAGDAPATELASEEAVGRCVEDLEKILTAAPPPGALLRLLSDIGVTVPLFRLYCFSKR